MLHHDAAARLRALAAARETPAARTEAEAALACPWWGLRVLAIQAVGRWGGPRNKAWLVARSNRPGIRHGAFLGLPRKHPAKWPDLETVAARTALLPHLDDGDAGWLLDLWFLDWNGFGGLYGAQLRLPGAMVDARARHELRHATGDARHALFWLVCNKPSLPCRGEVMRRLALDADESLARMARRTLGQA